ncbi:major facilitator superfamily domain-containing protein [Colletotrichum phormii]|uniref:Major facilitator superfamily domain-containing protein n=1 Tax=Colletotrichum phormii TaxID=359342 RepID=A0AAI9ZC44_9PEZI|nr:major facilitator superfamily domain-containing protein [Colletotrichum phormii]KAK1621799.1 major facilitator superfamily domain-containing protein [Colletotrichum phormii]
MGKDESSPTRLPVVEPFPAGPREADGSKDERQTTAPSSPEPGTAVRKLPAIDGGMVAWLQVSSAFALYWNSLGLLNSFGAFQTYYETTLLKNDSSSAIAWIGSVQVFFLMAGGVIFGPLYDLGYARSMLITGTFLVVFGFMMTSISTQYYQFLLAQGFCVGIGSSCLYIVAITLVPAYFTARRALAMGVATVGSSLGATISPLIFESLKPRIGFPWTVRAIGFVNLAMSCYAVIVARPRTKGAKTLITKNNSLKEIVEIAGLLNSRYMIQSYAQSHGMEGASLAKYLLVILNAVGIPGRIVPSLVADRFGLLNTYIGICTVTAITIFYWISVNNTAGNMAFAVLYGFFCASVVTLAPVVLASITDDLGILGTRLGFVAVLKGIGSLIGPPIAGAILGSTGSYLGAQLFTGLSMSLTVVFAAYLRVLISRRKVESLETDS